MADEPLPAQLGQCAEVFGDRAGPLGAQVHHVQVVTAELTEVLLDLPPQLFGPGPGQPLTGRVTARPDLGDDDHVVRAGPQRPVDQLVRGTQRREVEGRRVDVIDTELHRAAQHGDGPVAVARARGVVERRALLRQAHGAQSNAVDCQVAQLPGARRRCRKGLRGHAAHPSVRIARSAPARGRPSATRLTCNQSFFVRE